MLTIFALDDCDAKEKGCGIDFLECIDNKCKGKGQLGNL